MRFLPRLERQQISALEAGEINTRKRQIFKLLEK